LNAELAEHAENFTGIFFSADSAVSAFHVYVANLRCPGAV